MPVRDSGMNQATPFLELPVVPPFRLDLTVAALRRLATNPVDVLTPAGEYVRALAAATVGARPPGGAPGATAGPGVSTAAAHVPATAGPGARSAATHVGATADPEAPSTGTHAGPTVVRVRQDRPDALQVSIRAAGHADSESVLALLRRMLGTDRDLAPFYAAASRIPWLAPLARRMRGLKPPRYPTLWEACVNAIVFQQVSVHAASTIMRRLVAALGPEVADEGVALRVFPAVDTLLSAPDDILRTAGLSAAKIGALRRAGEAIANGELDEATLEASDGAEAARLLRRVKGIGPWTATLILLRGLGRLDVFPANDSGVARSLAFVAGAAAFDAQADLEALGPQRGMLYFHLLLARLEARGEIGRPTSA